MLSRGTEKRVTRRAAEADLGEEGGSGTPSPQAGARSAGGLCRVSHPFFSDNPPARARCQIGLQLKAAAACFICKLPCTLTASP